MCVGNDYCVDGFNCLKPPYGVEALADAARAAATMPEARVAAIGQGARATAAEHDLARERSTFLALLREILDSGSRQGGGGKEGSAG